MKNIRTASVVIQPSDGGQLATRPSSERAGHVNYSVKRDWRRDLDQEVRREGHDYFYPIINQPIGNQPFPQNQPSQPATSLPITLIHEVRHGNGDLAVCAGTETDLYVLFPWKNFGPYFEPGATPNDEYVENPGWIPPYEDPPGIWHTTYPPSGGYGYETITAGPEHGPISVPVPVVPPGTPTPDPDTTPIPVGTQWPGLTRPPVPTVPPWFEVVDVCSTYMFQISATDTDGELYVANLTAISEGATILQGASQLLIKEAAKVQEQYRQNGWNPLGLQGLHFSTAYYTRPLDAHWKITGDPLLDPDSGVAERYMGPSDASVHCLYLCGYFIAMPPLT